MTTITYRVPDIDTDSESISRPGYARLDTPSPVTVTRDRVTLVSGRTPPGRPVHLGELGRAYLQASGHHHAGCLRCGITLPFDTDTDARNWVIQHGVTAHGLSGDFQPMRTDAVCTLCTTATANLN